MDSSIIPTELFLAIFADADLTTLIICRGVCRHWRHLLCLENIPHTNRRDLLQLYLMVIEAPWFPETRSHVLSNLGPFDRQAFLDGFFDFETPPLPEDFCLWVKEWPAKAVFAGVWPGLPVDFRDRTVGGNLLGRKGLNVLKFAGSELWAVPLIVGKGTEISERAVDQRYLAIPIFRNPALSEIWVFLEPEACRGRVTHARLLLNQSAGDYSRRVVQEWSGWVEFLQHELALLTSITGRVGEPQLTFSLTTVSVSMLRHLISPRLVGGGIRLVSSAAIDIDALDTWIRTPQRVRVPDHFSERHLEHLYATLPTRNGNRLPYQAPVTGEPLDAGHHLVFFHPKHPEDALREDGTEPDFCPPEPFTRRMWVGGKIKWNQENVLRIGRKATADWRVESIVKKGFEEGKRPMVFVNQRILYGMDGVEGVCVDEERNHVYIADAAKGGQGPREVKDIPSSSDFSFSFTPTPVTLFRFSALIFNAHFNHLDKEFSQKVEGYPERLVHGPLTALMLLDTTLLQLGTRLLKSFEYRATNPLIVNRELTFHGKWVLPDRSAIKVWCVDSEGVVGMTGLVEV